MYHIRAFGVCLALVAAAVAESADAQQQRLQIGPLYPGISVSDAVAALPDAQWVETRGTPSGQLIGARAEGAVVFNNAAWNVIIGRPEHFGGDVPDDINARRNAYYDAYELRFERELGRGSSRECRRALTATVLALEAALGPFGQDPEFPSATSHLYGNPYGRGMRLEQIGAHSRMRVWPRDGMQPMYTFREPTAAFPYRAGISLSIWGDNSCTLKFELSQPPPPLDSAAAADRGSTLDLTVLPSREDRPIYEAPSASLRLPASFRLEDVRASRGNVAAWRNAVRSEMGPFNEGTLGTRNVPGVSGYFALFGDADNPPGIVHGRWFDADTDVDEPSRMVMMTFVASHLRCGGQVYWADSWIAEAAYLGPAWRPEFDALDAQLRGAVAADPAAQRPPPEDVTISYSVPPSSEDVVRYYPDRALARGQGGQVSLGCLVRQDHTMRCGVIEATPEEFAGAFAEAAVRLLQSSRVRIAELAGNGLPTAGQCMRRRVSFRMG